MQSIDGENLITIECPVCRLSFDHELREPRIFKNCGHSICHTCIMNFLNNLSSQHGIRVQCPVCRAEHFFTYLNNDQNIFFPKNYALIEAMSLKRSVNAFREAKCQEHHFVSSLLCFDPQCPQKRFACFECLFTYHADCKKSLIIDSTDLSRKVEYTDYTIDTSEFEIDLRAVVREFMGTLSENLTDLVNSFMTKINSLKLQVDLRNYDTVEKNLGNFTVACDAQRGIIRIKPYNFQAIKKAADLTAIKDSLKSLFIDQWPLQVACIFKDFLVHLNEEALSASRLISAS